MVMISTGNDAIHNVVGGEDVKNIENSKYKTRQGVCELFTKLNGSSCYGFHFQNYFDSSCYDPQA